MSKFIEGVIAPEWCGLRMDKALALLFPQYSRAQLTQWLKEERLSVSGGSYKPKDKVKGGERVTLKTTSEKNRSLLMPQDLPLEIIYEDEACIVVNKPAGLIVHPGAGNFENTLVNALIYHHPPLLQLPRAGLIHRLDKDTTGLLIIAKTEEAHTSLIRQMQARTIQRHYLALVYGHMISGGRIETGYGRDPRNRLKMAVTQQEKQAITLYSVKQHFLGATLLDVKLMTGRTHQIRVHMAYIKHPIVGDQLYGGRTKYIPLREEEANAFHTFKRQALHAYQLTFNHPVHEELITVNAPIPDDFNALIHSLFMDEN